MSSHVPCLEKEKVGISQRTHRNDNWWVVGVGRSPIASTTERYSGNLKSQDVVRKII